MIIDIYRESKTSSSIKKATTVQHHSPKILGIVDSDILRLQRATTNSVGQRSGAAVVVVRESTPNGQIEQNEVWVVDGLRPGVGGQVRLHDLPEKNTVDEPPHGLELLGTVDLEGVGVEVALARAPGALARAHEAVRLAAWPAWVDAAVHHAPHAVDRVHVLHNVKLSNGGPVPVDL